MRSVKVNVKIVPINSVKLWKDNPRKNDKSAEKLSELLLVHGIRTPIVVWEKNMTVYKGNTTLKAAKIAGFTDIPVILAQFKSNADAVSYALADNKSSEWSEWDNTILQKLLNSKDIISNKEIKTGFSEKEIDEIRLLKEATNLNKKDEEPEEIVSVSQDVVRQCEKKIKQIDTDIMKVHQVFTEITQLKQEEIRSKSLSNCKNIQKYLTAMSKTINNIIKEVR